MTPPDNPPLARPASAVGVDVLAVLRIQPRVDAAAFALLREGKNPTVTTVRARMGGASPNLVAPALQKWRFTLAAQLDANAGSALEVLPPAVLEIVQALWSRALFEAHRVSAESTSTVDAVEQLNAALREWQSQLARLQQREALLDEQLRELHAERRRIDQAAAALTRRNPPRSAARQPPPKQALRPRKLTKARSTRRSPSGRATRNRR
jgi:Plasmid replication region DNA-binding N-term